MRLTTIRAKLGMLGAGSVALALTIGTAAYISVNRIAAEIASSSVVSAAVRNHQDADMMHDALRGDVLAALAAGSSSQSQQALSDVRAHGKQMLESITKNEALPISSDIKALLTDAEPALKSYTSSAEQLVALAAQNPSTARQRMPEFLSAFAALETKMSKISDGIEAVSAASEAQALQSVERSTRMMNWVGGLAVILLIGLVAFIARSITQRLSALTAAVGELASGHLAATIDVSAADEIGDIARALASATAGMRVALNRDRVEWAALGEETRQRLVNETEVARMRSALEGIETNLMMCDENRRIVYANPAVVKMMKRRETELRRYFPDFSADKLIGRSIDDFHKDPSHQARVLGDVKYLPAKAEFRLGVLEFSVNATAILDQHGKLVGNAVEWGDIAEQKDGERQIAKLIAAATLGELGERIDTSGYQGFMKGLGDGINRLMDAVVTPLTAATDVMDGLSRGDLSNEVSGEFQGQFGVLKDAINKSIVNLRKMVSEIREASVAIGTGATEISQGNSNLSQRTEEQASSLEETASSMEELTGTVKQNADNARQASQLASGARDLAERGGSVVGNAVHAMSAINSASKKIADIIGVIDEIAFQTNLLALNAAVEAARAGEQGRGFAVVATEVRNLAQRSAAAAKEIKGLIKDSVEKVDEGSKLVDASGRTLDEIVTSIKKVSDIVGEIAAASQEQASGIDQINRAITQMDEVTQQNASLVEEAAAAAESLDEQSQGLGRLMQQFTVIEGGRADAGAPVANRTTPRLTAVPNKPEQVARPAAQPEVASAATPVCKHSVRASRASTAEAIDPQEWRDL